MTLPEDHWDRLRELLLDKNGHERAAYLLCGVARTSDETRLLVREVIPVEPEDIIESSPVHMKIRSRSYTRAMKRAHDLGTAFVFCHSHPKGPNHFSPQDDLEEPPLFRTAYLRIRHNGPHASLILAQGSRLVGRGWLGDGAAIPLNTIRIIGSRFLLFRNEMSGQTTGGELINLTNFDRQIRAFGEDVQRILGMLRVGVVGVGGTGSSVAAQLIRLGVGALVISDGQSFDATNVNRVYGSSVGDDDVLKVAIAERLASRVGLGTRITSLPRPVTYRSVFEQLRACDVVFGCTDDEWGRSLLTRLAIWYYIPVFDLGVRIDSIDGTIRSIQGRVTTLLPGRACLFCRRRITPERVRAESMEVLLPEEAARLRKEGYAPELDDPAPAVIPFTTSIAATAVSEFLHRLTGFLGDERMSSEVLHLIDLTRVRTNDRRGTPDCFCGDPNRWGQGDSSPFLGVTWRPE